jgi:hypothetical protein
LISAERDLEIAKEILSTMDTVNRKREGVRVIPKEVLK